MFTSLSISLQPCLLPPLTDTSPVGVIAMHRHIKLLFGFGVDDAVEDIAYYKLTRKMHKDHAGARFISSSESSSMQPISQGLSGLFQFIQDKIASLFGTALRSMSIFEKEPSCVTHLGFLSELLQNIGMTLKEHSCTSWIRSS